MKKILFEFYTDDDFDFNCCEHCPFHYTEYGEGDNWCTTKCSLANFGIDCPENSKKYYVQPVNN